MSTCTIFPDANNFSSYLLFPLFPIKSIEKDPAPDLVVEVDVHSSSIRRLDIYKQLGVPEIWRYTRTGIKIYNLRDSEYVEQEYSVTFPIMSGEVLDRFLALSESTDDNKLIREFRAWLKQRLGQ
jgi:Uma2 family endonuclease